MYTSEKTDRVIWQVTDTTGVPILGRAQAKLMNYISYPKIHPPQEQSHVSQDSLQINLAHYKPITPSFHAHGITLDQ